MCMHSHWKLDATRRTLTQYHTPIAEAVCQPRTRLGAVLGHGLVEHRDELLKKLEDGTHPARRTRVGPSHAHTAVGIASARGTDVGMRDAQSSRVLANEHRQSAQNAPDISLVLLVMIVVVSSVVGAFCGTALVLTKTHVPPTNTTAMRSTAVGRDAPPVDPKAGQNTRGGEVYSLREWQEREVVCFRKACSGAEETLYWRACLTELLASIDIHETSLSVRECSVRISTGGRADDVTAMLKSKWLHRLLVSCVRKSLSRIRPYTRHVLDCDGAWEANASAVHFASYASTMRE